MKKPFGNKKSKRPFAPSGGAFDGFRKSSKPRDESGEERPRFGGGKPAWKSHRDENERREGPPPWKKNRSGGSFGGGKPGWKRDRDESDRPSRDYDRSSRDYDRGGDRPGWKADRPAWKERPSYNQGPGSKPRKSYQKPSEFRKKWNDEEQRHDRPKKSFGGPKPFGKPKPYGQRDDRFERPAGDRFERPGGNKFERPGGNRFERPGGKRFEKPGGRFGRPGSDRYEGGGQRDDRRPEKRFDRPYNDRFEKPGSGFKKPFKQRYDKGGEQSYSSQDRVSVPANKPYQLEDARPAAPRKPLPFNPPARTEGPYAKPLVINQDDTNNAPARIVWVYDSMVGDLPEGEPAGGSTVFVYDGKSRFLGSAIYNPNSRIRANIFSLKRTLFDAEYIRGALGRAVKMRRKLGLLTESCRVVFGESDGLPGLMADKIGGYLVIQPLTFAVDRQLPLIIDRLNELIAPEGIVVRRDVPIRAKEGLEIGQAEIHGEIPERVPVKEAGVTMFANITGGHKTGFFLDQRFNREVIKPWCTVDARVLDLFCHVGGWGLRAARYGAGEVVGVDSSRSSLDLAEAGAEASSLANVSFVEDDVFEYLRNLDSGKLFDVIVVDPPAFAKTRSHYDDAFRAYLSLNYLAMKRLKPGGLLVTCSRSQALSSAEFNDAILTAEHNAGMQFRLLERCGAPADHPVLLGLRETEYLKCLVLERTE